MIVICFGGNISGTISAIGFQSGASQLQELLLQLKLCSDWDLSWTLNDLVSGVIIHGGSSHSLQATKVVLLYSKAGYVIVHNSCSVVHHSKGWL